MNLVAFDLSLTSTGHASSRGTELLRPPDHFSLGIARLRWIRDAVLERAVDSVVILEGYSFASRGQAIVSLGELGGVIRVALTDASIEYVDVPPACRAKYATGKGNASKEQVLAEAIRRLNYAGHSNDEADALWLRTMALDAFNLPGAPQLPALNRSALAAIKWPHPTSLGLFFGPPMSGHRRRA